MIKFLRMKAVVERTGLTRATIYEMIERGEFVAPVKIGARAIGFPEHEIEAWAKARMAARKSLR